MPEAGTATLEELRDRAKQRADMVNSSFVTDSEWDGYINKSADKLYNRLVAAYGDDYYVADPVTITTDGTNTLFALPNGTNYSAAQAFYKLLGVDVLVGSLYVPIPKFNFADRGQNFYAGSAPQSGLSVRLLYVPRRTPLSSDSDILDGIAGWDEYVVIDAAMKALTKEESDITALKVERDEMDAEIAQIAENRDAGNPQTVVDVYAQRSYPYYWSGLTPLRYRLRGDYLWLETAPCYIGGLGGFY